MIIQSPIITIGFRTSGHGAGELEFTLDTRKILKLSPGDFALLERMLKEVIPNSATFGWAREAAVPAPTKNALIARCPNCGRAVYAGVEVTEHIDDEGPELLQLLTAGFDLIYTDVETARSMFGCECGATTQEKA